MGKGSKKTPPSAPADAVKAAMDAGNAPAEAPADDEGTVYVQKGGHVAELPAHQVEQARGEGYAIATPDQVQKAQDREKFGTVGQAIRTGVERGVGTATFGLSDEAAAQIDPQLADEMRKRAEINPISGGVGKVAGFLAPGAIAKLARSGGALATGAELLAAPVEGMSAAGHAAEGLAQGIVGTGAESMLGRLAQKGVAGAARFGTEGAIMGAGDAVSEAALGPDHELTAEKVWAGAKNGFGVGALLGGGVGVGGGLVSEASNAIMDRIAAAAGPKDVEALAARQFGEAAPGLGEAWAKTQGGAGEVAGELEAGAAPAPAPATGLGEAWAKASAEASGKDLGAIRELGIQNQGATAREARRVAVYEGDAIRDEAKRAVRQHIDEINGSTKALSEEYMGGLKEGHVENSIRKGPEALGQQIEFAQGHIGAIQTKVDEMLADPTAYGQVADLKKLQRFIALADRGVEEAADAGNGTKAYIALDNMKKQLGRLAKPGSFLSTSSDMAVTREVRDVYEGLRHGLEDEGMWGKTAIDQARINRTWAKYIDTKSLFDKRLSTELGRDPSNPWVRQLTADPAKIDGYVDGLTSPKNDLVHQTIKDHLRNSKELGDAIVELTDITPEKLAEVGKIFRSTEGFTKQLDQAEKSLTLANQLKALEGGEHGGFGGAIAGSLLGAGLGGPVGAVGGAIAGTLMKPAHAIRQLAAIERLTSKIDTTMIDGVKEFASKAVKVGGEAIERGVLAADRHVENASPKGYGKVRGDLAEAAAHPEAVQAKVERMIGPALSKAAPSVAAQLATKSTQTLNYLLQKAPPSVQTGRFTPPTPRSGPVDSKMASFMRTFKAVKDPESVLKDFAKGRISPEASDALRDTAPKLHDAFVQQVMVKATEQAAHGKQPSYSQQIDLWILTGQPMHGTMEPQTVRMIQQMHQQKRGGQQGGGEPKMPSSPKRKINTSGMTMTMTQSLEGKGS